MADPLIDEIPRSGDIVKFHNHTRRVVDCRLMPWQTNVAKNRIKEAISGDILTGEIPENEKPPEPRHSNKMVVTYSKGGGRVYRVTLTSWRRAVSNGGTALPRRQA